MDQDSADTGAESLGFFLEGTKDDGKISLFFLLVIFNAGRGRISDQTCHRSSAEEVGSEGYI